MSLKLEIIYAIVTAAFLAIALFFGMLCLGV